MAPDRVAVSGSCRECLDASLSKHPFTHGLPPKLIKALAGIARACKFDAGDYLWRQGDHADALYLIEAGEVALEISVPHQGPLQIESILAGEVIGWSWLVSPHRWELDARAMSPVKALVLEGDCLRKRCERDSRLGYQVLKRLTPVLASRLQASRIRLLQSQRP